MISALIPTRQRPKRFRNTVESLLKTKKGEVEIISYVDENDPELEAYQKLSFTELRLLVRERAGLALIIHRLIEAASHQVMFLGADDIEFVTPGWDVKMKDALPEDGIGLVYCNDNWKQTCNHFMFHRKWVSLTGFFPDDFEHFGPDGYVMDVAKELKRNIYLKDVVIEHHHHKNGKAKMDETYQYPQMHNAASRDIKKNKDYAWKKKKDVEVLREYI